MASTSQNLRNRIDGQRVASLLQSFGFILSHDKCQFEPMQLFTHLSLIFNTRDVTFHYPGKGNRQYRLRQLNGLVTYVPDVMRCLGLTNFANVALPLSRLNSQHL